MSVFIPVPKKGNAKDCSNYHTIALISHASTGEGNGYPLQYSGLENSMDCTIHGVAESQTRLSDFHFTSHASQFMLKILQARLQQYVN